MTSGSSRRLIERCRTQIHFTHSTIKFTWQGMKKETHELAFGCLLCIASNFCSQIPKPLSTGTHATQLDQILHFDYFYLHRSSGIKRYNFELKEYLSPYCRIGFAESASSHIAAIYSSQKHRIFIGPSIWTSGQGPLFISSTLIADKFNILHGPPVACSLWEMGRWNH